MTTLETKIPFAGFYESMWSEIVDNELERFVENENERQSDSYETETYIADERLRIDSSDFAYEFMDFESAYEAISKDYVECFARKIDELATEIDANAPKCGIKFKDMSSPRYYNFETDRLFADISEEFVNWMFTNVDREYFAIVIKKRFTSRDGFISHYDNDLDSWLEKSVSDYDHNELETLMMAMFYDYFYDKIKDWEWDIFYDMSDYCYEYFDKFFDYNKWEAEVTRRRDEIKESLVEEIEEGMEPEIKLAPCPDTPDLFNEKNI